MSNTATCGVSGSSLRATSIPSTAGGLCNGASGESSFELGDQRVVHQCRPVEVVAAVHHPMPDRHQAAACQLNAGLGQQVERQAQRRVVIGDPVAAFHMMLSGIQLSRRRLFADLLDDADRPRRARVRVDQLKFQRRRAGVEHQHDTARSES